MVVKDWVAVVAANTCPTGRRADIWALIGGEAL
jgi:hypothetical protein